MKKFFANRWMHFVLLLMILSVCVFVVPVDSPFRKRIQFLTFDYYLTNYKRVPDNIVKIIDIDDESLSKMVQWPWPRTYIAEMVEKLTEAGAKSIAFDGVLAEPDRTSPALWPQYADSEDLRQALAPLEGSLRDNDKVLVKAIEDSGIFVAGFSFGSNPEPPRVVQELSVHRTARETLLRHASRIHTTAQFLPDMESAAAGNGSFMANAEIDGVIRRTSLVFRDEKRFYPALALEALRVSYERQPGIKVGPNKDFCENCIATEYSILIGDYEIPIEKEADIWVHYRDMKQDYIPAWKLYDDAKFEEVHDAVKDKIVFIGSSAEGLLDLRSTPLGLKPGVEIHVNALEQILDQNFLIRPQIVKDAENNFILSIGLLLIVLAPFIGASWLALICFALSGGVAYASFISFTEYGVLVDPVYPVLSVLVIYMLSSVLSYIRTEADRKQVREAFGLYISPDFMKELTKDPDKLKLGGETRDLTVMFTDIRSFTTISESMTPEALIQLMNDFLTPMSDLVMEHRGTIDKYMGDAMMAFWNAPLDDENHARNACMTALKMNKALEPINAKIIADAEKEGKAPALLEAGIGINTGKASVGNMGSRQRFAYSALGDTVNLASRLEGQTKQYGVRILIGEQTRRQASDMAALELDLIRVKGKIEPERIFVLLGDEEMSRSEYFKSWQIKHYCMLEAYRKMKWDDAMVLAEECQNISKEGMTGYYDMMQLRLNEMKSNPPEQGWDGVFVATTK
ncbi:MAG: adenylate/guanylate cyclase domain-containing protein [Pseudomonadota bacterium]|nr:adenylate/guanylate cyclase domain-containing protein [Pseudomonadota bacterium]